MNKVITSVISGAIGVVAGGVTTSYLAGKQIEKKTEKVNKFKSYYNLLNQWLLLRQEGKSLVEYFKDNNYNSIAIYGMGEMGNRLYDELIASDIKIKYAVDKEPETAYSELEVVGKDEVLESVDVMIVTAVFAFDEIKEELEGKADFPIISLEDVVYSI